MKTITLTQIIKNNPEETKPLVVDANNISVLRREKGGTCIVKRRPVRREYIVKETEDEINDMIENVYNQEFVEPQYDFDRDLSIVIKVTDVKAAELEYCYDEYDYTYLTDDFLVIVKDNIIIRQISIGKIIDIAYNKKEEE